MALETHTSSADTDTACSCYLNRIGQINERVRYNFNQSHKDIHKSRPDRQEARERQLIDMATPSIVAQISASIFEGVGQVPCNLL